MRIDRHEVDHIGAERLYLVEAVDDALQVAGRAIRTNVYLLHVYIAGIGYARKRGAILGRILGVQRLRKQHQERCQPPEPSSGACVKRGKMLFHNTWCLVL